MSNSTEHSRIRVSSRSRHRSRSPASYNPTDPQGMVFPDGPISEENAELLNEFVHPHHHQSEDTLIESEPDDADSSDALQSLPWWKRPSPLWLLALTPLSTIAFSATMAPKVEIYTQLACAVHKPDIFHQTYIGIGVSRLLEAHQASKSPVPCASDPVVQAAVAQLATVMTACMGILSCLTTGWWGSFSDRHGRTRVLGISIAGLLLTEVNFICVTYFYKHLPGGYWFLLAGPLLEGCLGGMTSGVAASHAYMADTTSAGTRSRIFSLALGLMFTGIAIGPTLGGLLIRYTQKTISVFFAAAAAHLLYGILIWFVIPESLSKQQMQESAVKHHMELNDAATTREMTQTLGLLVRSKRLFAFLSPLSIFLPETVDRSENPLKGRKKNWDLTLVALGYGFVISIMGSYTYKFQYAASEFGWTSEIMGYWLSLIGASRAFFLTVILPLSIRLVQFAYPPTSAPTQESETQPLLSSETETSTSKPTEVHKDHRSSSFDLGLARFSLIIEIITYTFIALYTKPLAFTFASMAASLGSGFSPAIQSVALELYTKRGGTESGKLFGGLSVVQSLSSQILGPALYGLVYMKTVASFPRMIFFLSVATLVISFLLLSFVRLSDDIPLIIITSDEDVENQLVRAEHRNAREATLVNPIGEEEQRGRQPTYSAIVKRPAPSK